MSEGVQTQQRPGTAQRKPAGNEAPIDGSHATRESKWRGKVALLTGGDDKPYVLGLTQALTDDEIQVEVVGSDALRVPELLNNPGVRFLNLRGSQRPDAGAAAKALRVARYYGRLICYAATSKPRILHILWNNKFELFDRTLLMLYYRILGKRVVLTAHNVNAAKRDHRDSWMNRMSLRIQYNLCDRIFVHTARMRDELSNGFGVSEKKIRVIPFGINQTARKTRLSSAEARGRLGIGVDEKVLLFFGQIAPYKGLAYLISAFSSLTNDGQRYRLIIAGKPKWSGDYWTEVKSMIAEAGVGSYVTERIEHVPDEETEVFFKAADLLILPYTDIFQSGVLFLGYNFGLPAVVTDVGSLADDVVEGKTGFVCKPKDASDLERAIERYFASPLFRDLDHQRILIKQFANERYSWSKVAAITSAAYADLVG